MASSFIALRDTALLPLIASAHKRSSAEALIDSYVTGHVAMDVGIGLAGFLPIPGAGIAATAAAVAAQAPVIYQPMAKEIAAIYSRGVDGPTQREVLYGAVSGGLADIAVEFGVEFFSEIAGELVQELGAGAFFASIPIIGGVVGMVLDVRIAWAMTWRVGMMIAIYHENGAAWIKDRKHTYEIVRKAIKIRRRGGLAPTIAQIVAGIPGLEKRQVDSVMVLAELLLSMGISHAELRQKLQERGISPDLIEKALARFSSR